MSWIKFDPFYLSNQTLLKVLLQSYEMQADSNNDSSYDQAEHLDASQIAEMEVT